MMCVKRSQELFNQLNLCWASIQGIRGELRHFSIYETNLRNVLPFSKGHSVFLICCTIYVQAYIVIFVWMFTTCRMDPRIRSVCLFSSPTLLLVSLISCACCQSNTRLIVVFFFKKKGCFNIISIVSICKMPSLFKLGIPVYQCCINPWQKINNNK